MRDVAHWLRRQASVGNVFRQAHEGARPHAGDRARQPRRQGQEQRPHRGLRGRGEGAAAGPCRLYARPI